jgi:YspA, cpYpsA-related SLOG family
MRIVADGDQDWECYEMATRVLRRIVARYGPDIVVIHGNEPGVDQAFAAAATELVVTAEVRVIDRYRTVHPTIGQRNRELLMGKADICIAVHNGIATCPRTLDFIHQALQRGIPVYSIGTVHAIPRRITRWTSLR